MVTKGWLIGWTRGRGRHRNGRHFVDERVQSGLRSDSSKLSANHDNASFSAEHMTVTFVGRPFPLTSTSLVYDDVDVLLFGFL
ncbi:hypothetical protein EV421DRAFT_1806202 [Armillaria borealis]|uniref:Uncharacterized protein n=1 Tax=Armillaria borealis TaxID=47425 RepID=A0AA39JIK3_9AGAR|nr:hypothetical protein EV421DRAFT_1806202 [Armillaria borealis]